MVNVNTVYQTVLALANKEQRGYITPQEFNLFANQAQMNIFEQYFYDLNQFTRIPGNDTSYSDMVNLLEEKISLFEKRISYNSSTNLPVDLYKIQTVEYNGKAVEYVTKKEYMEMISVPLCKPTNKKPVYVKQENKIFIVGDNATTNPSAFTINGSLSYIRKPVSPNWTYVIVDNSAIYNDNASDHKHFELHPSEQTELVNKILGYAGITLKDNSLYQIASAEESKNVQQQKA
tara:strand:- start:1559 stop:2257 length:699 start_codon:yes stop_codon:yes gene_type:complete